MANTSGDSLLSEISSVVLSTWWVISFTRDLGKLFQDAKFLMTFISEDYLFFWERVRDRRKVKLLIHSLRWVHGTWLLKWVYNPVFVFFLKIDLPSGDTSKSWKRGTSFWNKSTVKCKFGSKLFKRSCIGRTSSRLITNTVTSTYLA